MAEIDPPALPTEEDYHRYDRIWQRVSPQMNPYPEVRVGQSAPSPAPYSKDETQRKITEELESLLREELAQERISRMLAPQAPTMAARKVLRCIACDEARHARTLQAYHFLLAGEAYRVTVVLPPQPRLPWADRLRERWLAEAESGRRFERAARETSETTLAAAYRRLAAEEACHAERLHQLAEQLL